jgi:hypothetical protein
MLPSSEHEISNAKNFAFIPISPERSPTARSVSLNGQSRIGHYHRQRPTQSKAKSLSDAKALFSSMQDSSQSLDGLAGGFANVGRWERAYSRASAW